MKIQVLKLRLSALTVTDAVPEGNAEIGIGVDLLNGAQLAIGANVMLMRFKDGVLILAKVPPHCSTVGDVVFYGALASFAEINGDIEISFDGLVGIKRASILLKSVKNNQLK